MAERHRFLDRLTPNVRAHVRQIGGDPDFVDFVLGWYGLLRMDPSRTEGLPLTIWPYWSTSRQRQIKRELQRQYGDTWEKKWKKIQALARSYEPPKFKGGLFSIDPQGPKPAHGPFRWNFWLAVCGVMHYFMRIKKKPHWDVIAEVFFPKHEFNYAQSEWAKRKARLSGIDHHRSLNQVLSFYKAYKPVILKVLTSRVPIWASHHREHFERVCGEAGLMTTFQTICGAKQVGVVSPRLVASEGKDPAQSTQSRMKQSPTRTRTISRRRGSRD